MHVCTHPHTLVREIKTSDYNNRTVGSMQYKATNSKVYGTGISNQI